MSKQIQDTSANDDLSAWDTAKYSQICPDSNCMSTATTGGQDHLVVKLGGADDQTDTGMSGGRELL